MPNLVPTVLAGLAGCSPAEPGSTAHAPHGGHAHGFGNAEVWSARFDDPARDAWQQPDVVLAAMELRPDHRVADVGAGTGTFAVRLARAVPDGVVVATDIEPDMVRFVRERAEREGLPNLSATLATPTDAGLPPGSMDRILLVHVWHHVEDRVGLARQLAPALREGGRLVVVDFAVDGERGPPAAMRLPPEAVLADLAAVGLQGEVRATLPDQYVVVAARP